MVGARQGFLVSLLTKTKTTSPLFNNIFLSLKHSYKNVIFEDGIFKIVVLTVICSS